MFIFGPYKKKLYVLVFKKFKYVIVWPWVRFGLIEPSFKPNNDIF